MQVLAHLPTATQLCQVQVGGGTGRVRGQEEKYTGLALQGLRHGQGDSQGNGVYIKSRV